MSLFRKKLEIFLRRRKKELRKQLFRASRSFLNFFGLDLVHSRLRLGQMGASAFPTTNLDPRVYLPRLGAQDERNPKDSRSIRLVMIASHEGSLPLLKNSLLSLEETGSTVPVTIFVDSSFSSDPFFELSGLNLTVHEISSSISGQHGYSDFDESDFHWICSLKWSLISRLLAEGNDIVVYSDIDVVFFRQFEGFIRDVSQLYPMGFQSEARDSFPPSLCAGFMFFTQEAAEGVLELARRSGKGHRGGYLPDQELLNESLRMDIQSYSRIAVLPESHFPNGLMFPLLSGAPHKNAVHRITPFLFHANWVQGVDSKKSMLSAIGQWRVD